MFHPEYKQLIDKLPKSLVARSYQRLISHTHNSIPLDQIGKKDKRIEAYLLHTLEVYQNSLIRKRKKNIESNESLENLLRIYNMENKDTQTEFTNNMICNHKEEINRRVKEVEILYQRLLKYNRDTFETFMQDITKDYEEEVKANKKLRSEIQEKIEQIEYMEKCLASMQTLFMRKDLEEYPSPV
jgi:hypothetical protein